MNELAFDDPCLLFALRRESSAFGRAFPHQQSFPGAPCRAQFRGPSWLTVLVVETGIGIERTGSALAWVLGKPQLGNLPYRPKVILSAGFAGALQEGQQVGDVILATEVADQQGHAWPTTWPGELPAGEWRPPLHRGRVLTVDSLLAEPEKKRSLGKQYDALAVDMESAVVAEACRRHEVPFGCVRVISDDVHTPLSPRLVSLLSNGRISVLRTAAAVASSPGLAGEFWRLARQTRTAADQLGKALGELLTLTLSWGADL